MTNLALERHDDAVFDANLREFLEAVDFGVEGGAQLGGGDGDLGDSQLLGDAGEDPELRAGEIGVEAERDGGQPGHLAITGTKPVGVFDKFGGAEGAAFLIEPQFDLVVAEIVEVEVGLGEGQIGKAPGRSGDQHDLNTPLRSGPQGTAKKRCEPGFTLSPAQDPTLRVGRGRPEEPTERDFEAN